MGVGRDEASVFHEYAIPAIEDLKNTINNNNASQKYLSREEFPMFDNDQEMRDMTDTAFAMPDFNMDDHGPGNTEGHVIKHNAKLTKDTWLGDNGASCHLLTNDDSNMFDVQTVRSPIKVGSGKSLMATKMGKKRVEVIQNGETSGTFVLTEVKFVPGLFVDLFSIGKALKNGFKISNKGCVISLRKGDSVVSFDRMLPTERGFVSGVVLKLCVPTLVSENTFPQNAAAIALERGRRITLSEAHSLLGHAAIATVRKTAQSYG
jgi:hypothetical protein